MCDLEDFTAYRIAHSGVDEKPGGADISLKRMVGASGFEPPTSWSRTRRASQAALRPDRVKGCSDSVRWIASVGNRTPAFSSYFLLADYAR